MLKIKDDVDLKELEKYGFEITQNSFITRGDESCFEAIKELKKENEFDICILIHQRDISLRIELNVNDEYGSVNYEDVYFDTMYDLIKADLVEKVME